MHVQEWDGVESRINAGGDLEKKIGDDVGLDLGLTTITLVAIFCLPITLSTIFFFGLYVTSYTQYICIIRYPHNLHKVSQSSRKCLQHYKVQIIHL